MVCGKIIYVISLSVSEVFSYFRSRTLNFRKFKVAINPLRRMFLNFAKSFILSCWLQFDNKKWRSPNSFLSCKRLKQKLRAFSADHIGMVTYCAIKLTATCSPMIGQFIEYHGFGINRERGVIMTHQTVTLGKYWKLFPTTLKEQCQEDSLRRRASARNVSCESLYGGQFTLPTQLIKPNYLVILQPTQHHNFFRNLPPYSGGFCCFRSILC